MEDEMDEFIESLYADELRDLEIPGFVPIKEELISLVEFWAEQKIDMQYFMFWTGEWAYSWQQTINQAHHRINQIGHILGKDEVIRAIVEVHAKFKKEENISDREWDIYWNGTTEQCEEIREEIRREIEKQAS